MSSDELNSDKGLSTDTHAPSSSAEQTRRLSENKQPPPPPDESSESTQGKGDANSAPPQSAKGGHSEPPQICLDALLERLEKSAEEIAVKLQKRRDEKTPWEKLAQGAKDLGPVVTSLAAVTVTIAIAVSTCKFNERQFAVTQGDLKRSWLADFADSDEAKRKIGAIKLAAYGTEALPAVKDGFGISAPKEPINEGAVLTALTIYRSQPGNRPLLVNSMLQWLQDANPTLRLSVLCFYIEASSEPTNELSADEKRAFLDQLKHRLGPNLSNCASESGEFLLNAATFLTKGPFPEAKQMLFDITQKCPSGDAYEGARIQAVNMLPIIVKQQRLSKSDRDDIKNRLVALEGSASGELKENMWKAIDQIETIEEP